MVIPCKAEGEKSNITVKIHVTEWIKRKRWVRKTHELSVRANSVIGELVVDRRSALLADFPNSKFQWVDEWASGRTMNPADPIEDEGSYGFVVETEESKIYLWVDRNGHSIMQWLPADATVEELLSQEEYRNVAVCYRFGSGGKEKMGPADKFDRWFDHHFALHSFDYEPQYQNELVWKKWEKQFQDGKLPDHEGGWTETLRKSEEGTSARISGVVLVGGILLAGCLLIAGAYSWTLWAKQKERTKQLERQEFEKQKRLEKERLARRLRLESIRDTRCSRPESDHFRIRSRTPEMPVFPSRWTQQASERPKASSSRSSFEEIGFPSGDNSD